MQQKICCNKCMQQKICCNKYMQQNSATSLAHFATNVQHMCWICWAELDKRDAFSHLKRQKRRHFEKRCHFEERCHFETRCLFEERCHFEKRCLAKKSQKDKRDVFSHLKRQKRCHFEKKCLAKTSQKKYLLTAQNELEGDMSQKLILSCQKIYFSGRRHVAKATCRLPETLRQTILLCSTLCAVCVPGKNKKNKPFYDGKRRLLFLGKPTDAMRQREIYSSGTCFALVFS